MPSRAIVLSGNKLLQRLLLPGVCLFAAIFPARAQDDAFSKARKAYNELIRPGYNFHFGVDKPFAPSDAVVEGTGFIQPGAFPNASYCAHCHEEAYHQWRQALHSNSFRTPFYRRSVNILLQTKGIEYTRHCDSCHNPIAVLSGALTEDSKVDRSFDRDGLTCATCHSIQSLDSTAGNGGYVMGVPAVMVDENGKRIPGQVPYEQIMAHPDRHAKAVMKDFYRTPEFCAACHKANLPNSLNDYKFISAFVTYDEWQNSKYSHRNPLTFYTADLKTCQNCHMKREPATLPDYGAKNGSFASHRWIAGNTAVPFYYGFEPQLEKTIAFLKSGFLNVDLFALERNPKPRSRPGQPVQGEPMIAPLGSVPFRLAAGDTVAVFVVIQNKGMGHSLVPEVRDLYEPWVEFIAKEVNGNEIYHSGFLKADGSLDERAHSFTNRPVNLYGNFVDDHMVWTIHSVAYDNTIQAGSSTLVRYEFKIPADAKGPITITAKVNYRHLRQSYLNNVFGPDHPAYPVVELASRTRVLNLGDNPAGPPDPRDNPDWMRWNNLGVSLLEQLQYADAEDAFEHVVKLRPDYADGYTNIALTNILWEKYALARGGVVKALQLSPGNARALYYLALVDRRTGHSAAELAELQEVVRQYPQSRDARRELGISYYQQHRYEEAQAQFEALQAIDPDDLAAHYNLAILYRRKGMKQEAAIQMAAYQTRKIDPGAPTYSLDYLRKHPEISTESVPWHMHTDITPVLAEGSH